VDAKTLPLSYRRKSQAWLRANGYSKRGSLNGL